MKKYNDKSPDLKDWTMEKLQKEGISLQEAICKATYSINDIRIFLAISLEIKARREGRRE